ncbi:beta-hydroxyacyl-ACP dehydratase [Actinomycetes bacterium]|nr:beta-hydroxyacyl-ACP dehydratase [Actinomycetes bacterium]
MTLLSLTISDVEVGQELPPLDIVLTRTLITATAIASRDYQEVHHDPSIAVERGSQDIIMNILTTNGFVGRYITDWAGPNTFIKSVKVRLGVPNYPGETMKMRGKVTAVTGNDVTVVVTGSNSMGDHVTATIEIALP